MKYSSKVAALCISAAFATGFAFADGDIPTVTEVSMQQGPGNRIVTIKYKLDSYPAVVTLDVKTNDTVSIGGAAVCNAQGAVWRKVTSADADGSGWCTITWDPTQSWKDGNGNGFKAQDVKAEVTAWPLDNTPDYMAVDLTATGGADTQNYYPAADFVPSGVTNDIYKTSMLLMRKIMAKDVRWTMGSTRMETTSYAYRETCHQVELASNYYIGVYEITQAQWVQIYGSFPSGAPFFTTGSNMRPVEKVSHNHVRDNGNSAYYWPNSPYSYSFLYKLRDKTGIADFDLPSEAQWEFAARAGNGDTKWGNGSAMSGVDADSDANLNLYGRYQNSPDITVASGSATASTPPADGGTAIVGSYAPNDWGLYDMAGNVYELCLDWHRDNNTALNGAVNTEMDSSYSNKRVKRGGSWKDLAKKCRSAIREPGTVSYAAEDTGFRVICTAGLQ